MSSVVSAVTSGVQNAVSAAKSFVGAMVSAGADLIRGMINGIKSMAGSLVSAAKGVVSDAVSAAKNLLKIHSPSRVFKDIGYYTMKGMEIGLVKQGRHVVDETASIAKTMTNSFRPDLDARPAIQGVNSEMSNLAATGQVQADHTYTVTSEPNTTYIEIGLDLDDEAITAKVNGINARDGEVLSI